MYEEQLNELKTSLQTMNTTLKESNEREANLATVVREYEDKNVQLHEKIMDVEQQLENARNSINEQEEEIKVSLTTVQFCKHANKTPNTHTHSF